MNVERLNLITYISLIIIVIAFFFCLFYAFIKKWLDIVNSSFRIQTIQLFYKTVNIHFSS